MKYAIIILVLLSSCSPDYHVRKAIFKQPDILNQYNDTIKLTKVRLDTIFYDDTFKLVQTINHYDTVLQTRYLKPDTRYETRWKYKTIRDTIKIKERTKRVETRQDYRTQRTKSRGSWYWWLIIGAIVGFVIRRLIKGFFGI